MTSDYDDDDRQGFLRIEADDIDELRVKGVVKKIMDRIGTENPVYLSVDIDVLDPGLAPGTGTPEPGGWTMRELIGILRGVEGLNVVVGTDKSFNREDVCITTQTAHWSFVLARGICT